MKYILATLVMITSSVVFAEEDKQPLNFYEKKIVSDLGRWSVIGGKTSETSPQECVFQGEFDDGSVVEFRKDLTDGGFYVWAKNAEWSMTKGVHDQNKLNLNIYRGKRFLAGGKFSWVLGNKNTIILNDFADVGKVQKYFWEATAVNIMMPNSIVNFTFTIPGREMIKGIADCMEAYKKIPVPNIQGPVQSKAKGQGI